MNRMTTVTVIHSNGNTIIRSNGDSDELIKQKVSAELQRQKELKKYDWDNMILLYENGLLWEHLNKIHNITPPAPLHKKITNKIIDGIGFVYACIIVWSEQLGLIEYIGENKEWR